MRNTVIALVMALLPVFAWAGEKGGTGMTDNIHWLGHDAFKITGSRTIYTDPYKLGDGPAKADVILITHDHYDHCSPEDVAKIQEKDTVIVTTPGCAGKLKGSIKTVKPGDKLSVDGVEIEVVPSYNLNKKFHPQGNAWVGYIFNLDGTRIYIAGDTDRIPEMKNYRCDVALLPVGGTYTMTAEEAAQAAMDIMPKVAIPMHYGSVVGDEGDAQKFAKLLDGKIKVVIPRKE